jgi:hypothetical protein
MNVMVTTILKTAAHSVWLNPEKATSSQAQAA